MTLYQKFLVIALVVIILIGLALPKVSAHAESPQIAVSESSWVVVPQTLSITQLIERYSAIYGVSYNQMYATIKCESGFSAKRVSPTNDYGVVQINLPSHPEITKAEAFDPDFSIKWMAQQFAEGRQNMWVCWNNLFS